MTKVGSYRRLWRVALLVGLAAALLGVPLAASAADVGGFELDGNAAGDGRADWDALGSPLRFTGFRTDPTDSSDTGYGSGQTKDTADISQWTWEKADVTPAKSDIVNDYAAVYSESGNLVLYFGQNRQLDENGDANVGFWFLQNGIGLVPGNDPDKGTFSGSHVDGDLLIQSEFTNGGSISEIRVYKWQNGDITEVTQNVGQCASGKLGTLDACAIVNTGSISTSWADSLSSPYFFEGGLDLTGLFPQGVPCFSTFLTNTRTSQAESADLKDFSTGSIDTCGSITIKKVTTPSGGGPFSFTTSGTGLSSFELSGGGEKSFTKLQPGAYSVTESGLPSAWSLDGIACTVSGPGTNASTPPGATANITLGFLGNVECTYTNKRQPLLTLVKSVVNDNGGTAVAGAWTLGATGSSGSFSGTANTAAVTSQTVTAGVQYTLAESGGPSAYSASSWVCTGGGSFAGPDKITLGLGEDVTCTITNSDQGPSLTLVKQVVNDNGGSAVASNFTLSASGPTSISGPGGVSSGASFSAGTYALSETTVSGYTAGSWSCTGTGTQNGASITLGLAQSATCTITNNDQPATLIVKKVVVNDNGGTKQAQNFSFQVNGGSAQAFQADGQNDLTVDAGTYNVVEPAVAGYATTYDNCSGIVIAPGGSATCTVTNNDIAATLIVKKVVVNDDGGTATADDFSFQVNGGSAIAFEADGQNDLTVGAGTYSVVEPAVAGYTTSYQGCSNIVIPLAGSATCTVTNNDQPATLIVRKVVVNDDGGTATADDFSFQVNGGSALAFEADGQNSLSVDAGTYSVVEPAVTGYATSYSNCSQVVIPLGGSATCTVTNDDRPATLIVKKVVVNDDGGAATADDFSFRVNGGSAIGFEADGQNDLTVDAGTYNVVEPAVAGYATSYSNCSQVVIPLGGSATCTITNDDQPATLIVKKVVVNDSGGSKSAQDFSFQVNGGSAIGFEADGQNDLTVDAGTYNVVEPAVAGYGTTYDNCSNLVIPNGGSATCTVTNNDVAASLTVIKQVVNDDGGDAVAGDFTMTINGVTVAGGSSFAGAAAPGVTKSLTSVGAYSVTEAAEPGYTQTGASADCSGTIALGESKTCTITNDDQPATLIVKKVVVNDDGGTASADDFSFRLNGGSAIGFEADGQNDLTVDAGTYNVVEPAVAGYSTSYQGCSSIELDSGETATCTVTNDDQAATLIVKKVVVNDDGGTATADDFSFVVNGGQAQAFQLDGQNDLTVDAGTYNVTEPAVEGYETSYSNCSQVVIPNGGSATCTITNDDEPATLIVKKVVVNDNGGTATADDFSFQVNGGTAQAFQADGQNDLEVAAGTYNVTEPAVAGYTTTYQGCANIVLELGETATCVVTNNDVPRGQGSISVSKSANPTTIKEPGGPVTFSVTITNTSADVMVTIDNVVDDKFGDLDDSGGNGCFDVPINLVPGGKMNCTFTRQITGTGGTSHVNVVTASGTDASGNSLTASDDARVDITPRLIDLVIVKDASSPTPLNGTVDYSLTVTNKGPDTATNVQLADPAPAGITYLTANPSQGTCSLSPSLITCSLGSIAAGQTVTIAITGRATAVGTHTNTATVTGGGGRETNPADNVDSAVTIVPAPLRPPTAKPEPKPEVCLTLTVSPKMIKADGKLDKVTAKVTAGRKRVKGAKVSVTGGGVSKAARTNGKGVAVLRINPRKPGIITVTVVESNQRLCGPKRIGVVGVFLPPLTG